jgi:CheY-like chemotaxis protein
VAIVDVGLPGLDGLQLARLGRGAGYAGRLIAVSGADRQTNLQQAMRAGFDTQIDRPVDVARMRELLLTGF